MQDVVEYIRDLRESYEYLKDTLSPMEKQAQQLQRVLAFQSVFGTDMLSTDQVQKIQSFLKSPELKGLRMIYRTAIDALKYQKLQLETILFHAPEPNLNGNIAALIREIALFIHEAEQDYQQKNELVNTIATAFE